MEGSAALTDGEILISNAAVAPINVANITVVNGMGLKIAGAGCLNVRMVQSFLCSMMCDHEGSAQLVMAKC